MNPNTINPQTLCQATSQSNVWKLEAEKKFLKVAKRKDAIFIGDKQFEWQQVFLSKSMGARRRWHISHVLKEMSTQNSITIKHIL